MKSDYKEKEIANGKIREIGVSYSYKAQHHRNDADWYSGTYVPTPPFVSKKSVPKEEK